MRFVTKLADPMTKHLLFEGDDAAAAGGGQTPPTTAEAPAAQATPPASSVDPDVLAAERRAREAAEKQLADERKAREELERKEAERERKRLEDEGQWRELAERETARADAAHRQAADRTREVDQRIMTSELKARLAVEGVDDLDFHVLADRSKLRVNERGDVEGLDDCVADLKTRKPSIFTGRRGPVVTGSARAPQPSDRGAPDGIPDVRNLPPDEYKKAKQMALSRFRRRA